MKGRQRKERYVNKEERKGRRRSKGMPRSMKGKKATGGKEA